jgi:hypothetical protein
MLAKFTDNAVPFAFDAHLTGHNSPHVIYANLDFKSPTLRKDARHLLKWLDLSGSYGWEGDYNRTLLYLRKHQHEFRNCLEWITEGYAVDFSSQFERDDENTRSESRDKWEHHPSLKFLRKHIFLHGRVTFEPEWQEFSCLSGLRLTQQKPLDPLDPICWHLLSTLVTWGGIYVRRCRYSLCGKFFHPPTQRKVFCSDSCRALHHTYEIAILDDEEDEDDAEAHRLEKNKDYMRKYRAHPVVKGRPLKPKP